MKNKFYFLSLFVLIPLLLCAQTLEGLSLGDITFVKPSPDMTMASRSLRMRLSTEKIPSDFYTKVGGVAFIQTATPTFDIKSLKLNCNLVENNANVVINGHTYQIPLEVWQLQPIVEFVDDHNNAAITIYGDEDSRIKMHEAFLDKLIGLRLLQTDLLPIIGMHNQYKYPVYDDGEYIMTPQEKQTYHDLHVQGLADYSEWVDAHKDWVNAYNNIYDSVSNILGNILGVELPAEINSNKMLDKEGIEAISADLTKIDPSAADYRELETFYAGLRNTFLLSNECNKYEQLENVSSPTDYINYIFSSVLEERNTYIYTDFDQAITFSIDNSSGVIDFEGKPYYRFAAIEKSSTDTIVTEATNLTNYLKEEGTVSIYWSNPLIYHESETICQWSAFFRYVKQNHPTVWQDFKKHVKSLTYDAPYVWTPINYESNQQDLINIYETIMNGLINNYE